MDAAATAFGPRAETLHTRRSCLLLSNSMRQQRGRGAGAERVPAQIADAKDVSRHPLVVKLPRDANPQGNPDRASHRRSMIHAHRLQRTVRHALDERGHQEMLELVDSKP